MPGLVNAFLWDLRSISTLRISLDRVFNVIVNSWSRDVGPSYFFWRCVES